MGGGLRGGEGLRGSGHKGVVGVYGVEWNSDQNCTQNSARGWWGRGWVDGSLGVRVKGLVGCKSGGDLGVGGDQGVVGSRGWVGV